MDCTSTSTCSRAGGLIWNKCCLSGAIAGSGAVMREEETNGWIRTGPRRISFFVAFAMIEIDSPFL